MHLCGHWRVTCVNDFVANIYSLHACAWPYRVHVVAWCIEQTALYEVFLSGGFT